MHNPAPGGYRNLVEKVTIVINYDIAGMFSTCLGLFSVTVLNEGLKSYRLHKARLVNCVKNTYDWTNELYRVVHLVEDKLLLTLKL